MSKILMEQTVIYPPYDLHELQNSASHEKVTFDYPIFFNYYIIYNQSFSFQKDAAQSKFNV